MSPTLGSRSLVHPFCYRTITSPIRRGDTAGGDGLYNPVTHIGVQKSSTEGVVSVETRVKANCELPQRQVGCDLHEPSRDSFCGYVPAAEASTAPEEWDSDNDE